MQQLTDILRELGLTQYHDAFVEQGFDTWDTILDITESDMDALGVKLGHRRKLQRRIAKFRGVGPEIALVSPSRTTSEEAQRTEAPLKQEQPPSLHQDSRGAVPGVLAKRKYRRHPKPDECAPERPPSAYVLFSNKMREDLKGRSLSFTEIAKLVGENWQSLSQAEREPFETQAQLAKDKYNHDLAEYKKTPEYKKYLVYLQEFKAKHSNQTQDKEAFKRIKLSEFGSTSDPQIDTESASPPTTIGASAYHRQQQGAQIGVLNTHGSRSGSESPHEFGHEHGHEHGHDPDYDHDHDHDHDHEYDSPRTNGSRKRRIGSTVSVSDSQYSDSPTPGPVHSPMLSQMSDMHIRRSPHSHPRSLSPRETSQTDHAAARRADHGNGSTHVSLPSLSDMFDKRQLSPTGLAPPTAKPESGISYHGVSASASEGTSPGVPPHGMATSISSTSNGSASHPRTPMDGSLPIHALLSGKSTSPNLHHASLQSQGHHQYQHQYPSQHPSQHPNQHQTQHQHQHHQEHPQPHHAPHPSRRAASPGHSPPPQSWSYAQPPPPEHQPRYIEQGHATAAQARTGSTQYPSYS